MSPPIKRTVEVRGETIRVWEKGEGEPIGYFAGLLGLSRWTPFLDAIAARRRVIVPSFPGFPGAAGEDRLDDVADWVCTTLDILEATGLAGRDMIGASIGGSLALEAAAFSRASIRRLVLLAPLGLHVAELPIANFWSLPPKRIEQVAAASHEEVARQLACPDGVDEIEWSIITRRALTAGARLFWPMIDVGLAKRLYRVTAPACIVWGADDQVISPAYAALFQQAIAGETEVHVVSGGGHLVDWDRPAETAMHTLAFLER